MIIVVFVFIFAADVVVVAFLINVKVNLYGYLVVVVFGCLFGIWPFVCVSILNNRLIYLTKIKIGLTRGLT